MVDTSGPLITWGKIMSKDKTRRGEVEAKSI